MTLPSPFLFFQDGDDGLEGEPTEEEPAPETRIEVEIPKVCTDLGSELYFVKLPNFLSVEPRSESHISTFEINDCIDGPLFQK